MTDFNKFIWTQLFNVTTDLKQVTYATSSKLSLLHHPMVMRSHFKHLATRSWLWWLQHPIQLHCVTFLPLSGNEHPLESWIWNYNHMIHFMPVVTNLTYYTYCINDRNIESGHMVAQLVTTMIYNQISRFSCGCKSGITCFKYLE